MKRLLAFAVLILAMGCKPSDEASTPTPAAKGSGAPAIDESGPHAAGKKVFNTQVCKNCHTIGGEEPKQAKGKKNKGPDLAAVAKDPEHTPEWLSEFIRNPKSKYSSSRMPAFEGKINEEDFKALIEYLSSLK